MKILIAMDVSICSEWALTLVTRMRWPPGSRVLALSVVNPLTAVVPAPCDITATLPELLEQQRHRQEAVLERAERQLRAAGFPTERRIVEGDAREAVLEVAQQERTDVIVVGSRGRAGTTRCMLGSVSSHIVAHAPCSVLVVRQADVERPSAPLEKNPS